MIVTMPRPPSTNKLWSRGGKGKRVRSPAYTQWLHDAGWIVRMQMVGIPPIDCRFNVQIEVPISRRDTDNWTKPCLDLCQHVGVVTNDGNMHKVEVVPVDRDDCRVAFWPLPEMGSVRAKAKPAYVGRVWKPKPKGKQLTWLRPL